MLFLMDEDVPEPIGHFLERRGHEVRFVKDAFGKSTADPVVAAGGDPIGAIIVTFNHKDFARLVRAVPEEGRQRFRNLSRITFRCHQSIGLRRMQEVIDIIPLLPRVRCRARCPVVSSIDVAGAVAGPPGGEGSMDEPRLNVSSTDNVGPGRPALAGTITMTPGEYEELDTRLEAAEAVAHYAAKIVANAARTDAGKVLIVHLSPIDWVLLGHAIERWRSLAPPA